MSTLLRGRSFSAYAEVRALTYVPWSQKEFSGLEFLAWTSSLPKSFCLETPRCRSRCWTGSPCPPLHVHLSMSISLGPMSNADSLWVIHFSSSVFDAKPTPYNPGVSWSFKLWHKVSRSRGVRLMFTLARMIAIWPMGTWDWLLGSKRRPDYMAPAWHRRRGLRYGSLKSSRRFFSWLSTYVVKDNSFVMSW